jgi:hypothetical protein
MPAVRRRLLTLCSRLSPLLSAAVCVQWVRSHRGGRHPGWITWEINYDGVLFTVPLLPYWLLLLPTIALPLWWMRCRRVWVMDDRQAAGQCFSCGYDLRAARHNCPECGLPLPTVPPHRPAVRP